MTSRSKSIPELFGADVIKGLRQEHSRTDFIAVRSAVESSLWMESRRLNEAPYYYALCERAWLHWSRHALEFITRNGFQQATNGTYNPAQVGNAHDAAAAHSRCGLHLQLLDLAPTKLSDPDWPWQLEAARHVITATQQALSLAAKLNASEVTTPHDVRGGVAHAADAFTAAVGGKFVADPGTEARATLEQMTLGAARAVGRAAPTQAKTRRTI